MMEVLQRVDTTHLKEQCPAFKEGCPFAKVENKQTLEAIEKCPEFKDGCPFKDSKSLSEVYEKLSHVPHAAGHESELSGEKLVEMFKKLHNTSECLEEKLGDCPVFHRDQGCPFKSVRTEEGKHLVEPVESVSHDKHVTDELKAVDTTHLKEQCPAFKEGCPFAKVENKQTLEAIEKCPEFKDGCPFKDSKSLSEVYQKLSHVPHAAGHESELSGEKLVEMFKKLHDTSECLEEKLGDCPVFHKDQGCPFKSVRTEEGKHLVEPVESVSHDKHVTDELKAVDTTHLKEQCPAFKEGCPFAKVENKQTLEAIEKCPEFKDGCPFKDSKSLSEVYQKLSHVPHAAGHESELSGEKLVEMFKKLHDTSECLEEKLGDCPVFHRDQGCPFKSVRTEEGKHLVEPVESVSHDKHVTDELKAVDTTHLKEQCPAFKEGCPFAKVENKQTLEAIEKCPEFKNGCPFKDSKSLSEVYEKLSHVPHAAGHESELSGEKLVEMFKKLHDTSECLEEKLGDCPVFHRDQGCPFKSVRTEEGKHLVEPVESVSHDKHVTDELKAVDTTHLKEQCPAFKEGCPFAKVENKQTLEAIEKCPEFKDGCPFKDSKSLSEVYEKLSHVPHAAGHESELSGEKLVEMFRKMHDTSECLEEKLGDCPVFHRDQGCPFKSVRTEEGKHLVEPVESVSHDKHVVDELKKVDTTHLKEQCPAFKEGCPFAKVADKETLEAIEKCPEFKNGCPFKDSSKLSEIYEKLSQVPHCTGHEQELSGQKLVEMFKKIHDTSECLEEKLGDCPVFHRDQGCPFKSVRTEEGKHLVEPVESVMDTHGLSRPSRKMMSIEVSDVKEACPAFAPSCPFAKVSSQDSSVFKNAIKCPKFMDGCAFSQCRSLGDVYAKLQEIPNLGDEKGSHGEILESMLQVHKMCVDLENEIGQCPVFHSQAGCPFKTVCTDGQLLVEKLELYLSSRVLKETIDSAKEAAEQQFVATAGVLLSKELKAGTKMIHATASTQDFIKELLKGNVTRDVYRLLLSQLYFIYSAMEEENERNESHPALEGYNSKHLHRKAAIIEDLEYFYGSEWRQQIAPINATTLYVARLHQLGAENPFLLIAHEYTRYMGDLSGGRIIMRGLKKALGLVEDGVRLYQFNLGHTPEETKDIFRRHLDALALDKASADLLVEESIKTFHLNIDMFTELGEICADQLAAGKKKTKRSAPIQSSTAPDMQAAQETASDSAKCPFFNPAIIKEQSEISEAHPTADQLAAGNEKTKRSAPIQSSTAPDMQAAPETASDSAKCPFFNPAIIKEQSEISEAHPPAPAAHSPPPAVAATVPRSTSNVVLVLGIAVALFAVIYAYLLA